MLSLLMKFYRALVPMAGLGMRKPSAAFLFQTRRRYVSDAITQVMTQILSGQHGGQYARGLIRGCEAQLIPNDRLVIAAAVVGDELRVNAYPLLHDTTETPVAALWQMEGISMFMVDEHTFQHQFVAPSNGFIATYEPAFSWAIALEYLEDSAIHHTHFRLLQEA